MQTGDSTYIPDKKGDENMEMVKGSFTPLDVSSILTRGQVVSSQEILSEITPIEWSEDVLSGNHKDKTIIKSKGKED